MYQIPNNTTTGYLYCQTGSLILAHYEKMLQVLWNNTKSLLLIALDPCPSIVRKQQKIFISS